MIPTRSFRIVSSLPLVPAVENLLTAEGFQFEPEPFSSWCRKLLAEPFPLGSSLAAYFGYIYIQDRSSMLPSLALGITEGSVILDMAASPGSKTGFLAQLAGEKGFVLANEPSASRLGTLRANLRRTNLLQTGTCSHDGATLPLFAHSWPHILLDPPCSGWGTAEKNPKTLTIWRQDNIAALVNIQRRLLTKAAELLAPGGRLLYSTCTTNKAENEAQTAYAVEKLGLVPLKLPLFPGFSFRESSLYGITIDGPQSGAQGFYLSLLTRENGETEAGDTFKNKHPLPQNSLAGPVLDPDLLPPGQTGLFRNTVRFLPARSFTLPQKLSWQAPPLGSMHGTHFSPLSGLRTLLPPPTLSPRQIVFEDVKTIRALLSGTAIATGLENGLAGIWWHNLPLAIARIKNGRILAPTP